MAFDSVAFALFLPVVFCIYWMLHNRLCWQNTFLILASYIFYGWWDWRFLFLIIFTTLCSYYTAIIIEEQQALGHRRKAWIASAFNIVANLAILGTFKYLDFFIDGFSRLLATFGWEVSWPLLHIILPVGISFYTFQAFSYTIDVYRGKIQAERNLLPFAAYICFFPQLVAGPIERASDLLPQMKQARTFSYPQAVEGGRLILWGLFKKMIVADNCAVIAGFIFHDYQRLGTLSLLYGAFIFSFQIYADFSGYSDIAIGTARLFGIRLSRNFNNPYLAASIPEFWRRWHITLTTWFRDYVYFPLGGSRCSNILNLRNTIVVFLLCGLWHGAGWPWLAWGLYHGLLFIPYCMHWIRRPKNDEVVIANTLRSRLIQGVKIAFTFLLVSLGRVLYHTGNLGDSLCYIKRIFCTLDFSCPAYSKSILLFVAFMLWAEWRDCRLPQQRWARWLIYYILLFTIFVKGTAGSQFMYFQF